MVHVASYGGALIPFKLNHQEMSVIIVTLRAAFRISSRGVGEIEVDIYSTGGWGGGGGRELHMYINIIAWFIYVYMTGRG